MKQIEKAQQFAALHVEDDPLVLYNVWDAGSGKAVAAAGARALGTSSWAVAAAQGYDDGEGLPLDLLLVIAERIASSAGLPVTVDFEGGYAETEDELAANVARLIRTGIVGVNFEDRVVKGEGLYAVEAQCRRIGAIRRAADELEVPLFINARTDLFLQTEPSRHEDLLPEAAERAAAYRAAGASGFFVPGLVDDRLMGAVCAATELPVNVMMGGPPADWCRLKGLGVARLSYGPAPFISLMSGLESQARAHAAA